MTKAKLSMVVLLALALSANACKPQVGPAAATANPKFSAEFIKVAVPVVKMVTDTIPITGKLTLDKQRTRIAAARVAGRLGRIFVFEGQAVKEGQALAELYSPEYISAQNEYLLAKRFRDTLAGNATDAELGANTKATLESARNKLKVLGATPADIATLEQRGTAGEYLEVRAPIAGVVTARNVDPGAYLNVGDALMSLANLDTLWLVANTYDADYPLLRIGQTLDFGTSSLAGESFKGRIAFIAPSVDPTTHTLPIRCDVPNPGLRLRAEMYVSGSLQVGTHAAAVVPRSAVIHIRDADFVVVQTGPQQYRRVKIQGHRLGSDEFAITSELAAATAVVVDGALLLNETIGED